LFVVMEKRRRGGFALATRGRDSAAYKSTAERHRAGIVPATRSGARIYLQK
jgi:hypothetical protein